MREREKEMNLRNMYLFQFVFSEGSNESGWFGGKKCVFIIILREGHQKVGLEMELKLNALLLLFVCWERSRKNNYSGGGSLLWYRILAQALFISLFLLSFHSSLTYSLWYSFFFFSLILPHCSHESETSFNDPQKRRVGKKWRKWVEYGCSERARELLG